MEPVKLPEKVRLCLIKSKIDPETVRVEVAMARRVFADHDWPVIDVTRRSIEETAATILQLYERRSGNNE